MQTAASFGTTIMTAPPAAGFGLGSLLWGVNGRGGLLSWDGGGLGSVSVPGELALLVLIVLGVPGVGALCLTSVPERWSAGKPASAVWHFERPQEVSPAGPQLAMPERARPAVRMTEPSPAVLAPAAAEAPGHAVDLKDAVAESVAPEPPVVRRPPSRPAAARRGRPSLVVGRRAFTGLREGPVWRPSSEGAMLPKR